MILQALRQFLSRKHTLEYLAFVFILILATVLSCYRIAEPAWDDTHGQGVLDGHHGTVLSENGHYAQNYLRFGYLRTKFGQVTHWEEVKSTDVFHYYLDHPPLITLLISLSFRLLGTQAWSARLVTVTSSLGILLLVFFLARRLADVRVALFASFLLALTPMYNYYARLSDQHVLASFFSLLTFVFYLLWIESGTRWFYVGIFISFILGALSDWVTYFVVPPILLHYLALEYRRSRNLRFVILFGLAPIVLFGTYLGWTYSLAGKGAIEGLLNRFLFRTTSGGATGGTFLFTVWDFYAQGYTRARLFLTPTICLLSIVWLVSFIVSATQGRFVNQDAFLFSLLLFGLSHDLVLRNLVFIHDYSMFFHLVPFFAIAATLGAKSIAQKIFRNRWTWTVPLVLIIGYSLGTQSISAWRQLHKVAILPDLYLLGARVNAITERSAKVMGPFNPDLRMLFHADRPWLVMRDLNTMRELLEGDRDFSLYVLDAKSVSYTHLRLPTIYSV